MNVIAPTNPANVDDGWNFGNARGARYRFNDAGQLVAIPQFMHLINGAQTVTTDAMDN